MYEFFPQQVMKFAEASQEIFVKPTPMKTEVATIGLTPGRRRANQVLTDFGSYNIFFQPLGLLFYLFTLGL